MQELDFVQLPEWGTRILCFDYSNQSDFLNELRNILLKDRFFQHIISVLIQSNQQNLSLEQYLNSVGQEQFRKQILHKIVCRVKTKSYEQTYEEEDIRLILDFEQELSFLKTHGNSRLLLLGIYLYLQDSGEDLLKEFVSNAKTYLKQRTKVSKPDYILVMLYSLLQRHPRGALDKLIAKISYDEIFANLEDSGQDLLIRNFIRYCYSVHESTFIKEKEV
jgi:hypothetical protein